MGPRSLGVGQVVAFVVRYVVVLVMFSTGLGVSVSQLSRVRSEPRLFGRALLVIEVLVPLAAFLIVRALGLPQRIAGLILLLAVCPGAPLSLWSSRRAGASPSAALDALLLAALTSPLSVPCWVFVFAAAFRSSMSIDPLLVLRVVAATVLLPLGLGAVLRAVAPRAAEILRRVLDSLSGLWILAAAALLLAIARPAFSELVPVPLLALLLITFTALGLGHLAGGPRLEDRGAIAFAAALGNPAIALAIVSRSRPELAVTAPIAAFIVLRAVALLPYRAWLKRRCSK
jgi:BASS family bile acid:Na+ symporter